MFKRAYSNGEFRELKFPAKDYDFPAGEGSFVGKLVMKRWINQGLLCYFDTSDGKKYKLCVWFRYELEESYRPAESDLDISKVPLYSIMKVEYTQTTKGKTKWVNAEVIEG